MKLLHVILGCPYPPNTGISEITDNIVVACKSFSEQRIFGIGIDEKDNKKWSLASPNNIPVTFLPASSNQPTQLSKMVSACSLNFITLSRISKVRVDIELGKIVEEFSPDLIILHHGLITRLIRKPAAPTLLVPPDAYSRNYRNLLLSDTSMRLKLKAVWYWLAYRKLEKGFLTVTNGVATLSECDREFLAARSSTPSRYRALGSSITDTRRELGVPPRADAQYVGIVGDFRSEQIYPFIKKFVINVWKRLYPLPEHVRLLAWGSDSEKFAKDHPEIAITALGWTATFEKQFQDCRFVVFPQMCGSGIQTKLMHAMNNGMCCIVWAPLLKGVAGKEDTHAFTFRDWDECLIQLQKAFDNPELVRNIGSSAKTLIDTEHSQEKFRNHLRGLLEDFALVNSHQ